MTNSTLETLLDQIDGLGRSKKAVLADHFSTIEELSASTVDELAALDGIGRTIAGRIVHAVRATLGDSADVVSIRHADRRVNIPTDEHAHLVDVDGGEGPNVALYPRDPSLDPQLVWTGKDELDQSDLAVPVVPIYIQEKVDPQVIVENLRATAVQPDREPELSLFDDFDGIDDPMASIEFYRHEANWSNRMVLGDALVAMTSMAEKEDLKGKVQTIYVDPPYGISFGSNWQVSTRSRSVKDGKDLTRQPEQVKAFRDTWKHGIGSYLTYLRDRLQVAHRLLNDTGSVFVQISDENVHLVRSLLDEVFGASNFVSLITFSTKSGSLGDFTSISDYVIWYARDRDRMKYRPLFLRQRLGADGAGGYSRALLPSGETISLSPAQKAGVEDLPEGARPYTHSDMTAQGPGARYVVEFEGREFDPTPNWWKTPEEGMQRLIAAGRMVATKSNLVYRRFLDDSGLLPLSNLWSDTGGARDKSYVVQTSRKVIQRCVLMTSDPGDLVLDPTCGSGTTAFVAEQWGRRWITIDTSRVALALARQRIMGARFPYYLLADTAAGAEAESQQLGRPAPPAGTPFAGDIRRGFVYKRQSRVTPSTISNCEDIYPGISREEADAAIRRAATLVPLHDDPVEDKSKVRVAGPFTVESLSPHRTVAPAESMTGALTAAETTAAYDGTSNGFVEMVLDNLAKSGVQNGYREDRLNIGWLEPHAGDWVHAVGGFTGADGTDKTIAVSIGPETGTVGREQVAEAAKEAVRSHADLLLICAYAFEAGAGEQAVTESETDHTFSAQGQRQVGRLRVLNVRINADLMMEDDLKNTGAGNLFMVFGEPDIEIAEVDDDHLQVELAGLDIYDPNKGTVRSTSSKEIACWFIDSNYDGESFFVRHAYFTGGGTDPYASLKKALNAEIDANAWAALYRTTSLPFPRPSTGKIAVKAINHYGDEAMKVFTIE